MTNPLSMTLADLSRINSFFLALDSSAISCFLIVTLNNSSRNTCNLKYDGLFTEWYMGNYIRPLSDAVFPSHLMTCGSRV